MKNYLILFFLLCLTAIYPTQADTNHLGAGGVFELDLGDNKMPLTPNQEREQKLLEEQLETKQNNSSRPN